MTSPLKNVIIVGAGAAGLAAAISAARKGCKVVLLEGSHTLGGIVVRGLIHTLGGLYDSEGNFINDDLPVELTQRLIRHDPHTSKRKIGQLWTLSVSPNVYQEVVEEWIKEEPNIQLFLDVKDLQVSSREGYIDRAQFSSQGQEHVLSVASIVDCTGNANVASILGAPLLMDDPKEASGAMIFKLDQVAKGALAFPRNSAIKHTIDTAVKEGVLPKECSNVWLDRGILEDEVYVKLSIPAKELLNKSLDARDRLFSFLLTIPEFAHAKISETGEVCFRGGNRYKGEYQLTGVDVRELRRFTDTACRCAWPIEYWDAQKGVKIEYLRSNGHYEIPFRSLKVIGFKNLWTAGKCFSSDHLAQASARVVGCCWAMGDAVGKVLIG